MGRRLGRLVLLWGTLGAPAGCGSAGPAAAGPRADLLVFAPHPDDETLGCAGILLQALKRGERVKVVLFTNGDGFPDFASRIVHRPIDRLREEDFAELARFRQNQSLAALEAVGGAPEDLIFLGYPDSGLEAVAETRGPVPYRQKYTGRTATYGIARPDFHASTRGRPAPYTAEAVRADVADLIRSLRPLRICVTHEADRHPDHRAAFRFVRDAVGATGWSGELDTYLIHGGPEWPWPPGSTPGARFDAHEGKEGLIPQGVPWPPPRRVPLGPEEAAVKAKAIRAHTTHLGGVSAGPLAEERAYLESFVKAEEVFWPWTER
ncbi:MAG TPA: PIG-L family deacetylase [Planctomycetota bacterium]|nr:PIG-L family deacetylase [Planctomycetota bacterium]